MEPVGVSIGVASLLSLFKTCLSLHEAIECGRRLGTDYEVLATKVGIERVRLALWGDGVGLSNLTAVEAGESGGSRQRTQRGLDARLGQQRIVDAVSDILCCMRRLFEDTSAMLRRYGLEVMPDDDHGLLTEGSWDGNNNTLATTFQKTYARLQASASGLQQSTSLVKTARWAIRDKKRFQRFVDDLRDFNDSLFLLFPDVDVRARSTMAAEIQHSADVVGLQVIEQAVSDLEAGGAELADAASSRITQLSQSSASVGGAPGIDVADADDNESIGEVQYDLLVRELAKLGNTMRRRTELRGSLGFSYFWMSDGETYACPDFYGMDPDDFIVQRHAEREHVKPLYPAWALMGVSDKKGHDQSDFTKHDTESRHLFVGKYPGTRSIDGYMAEFNAWTRGNNDTSATFYSDTDEPPAPSIQSLVERVRSAQVAGDARPLNEEAADKELLRFMGLESLASQGGTSSMTLVPEILMRLNRSRTFPNVLGGPSLSQIALSPPSAFSQFLVLVVLAHELRNRMVQRAEDVAFGNVSPRIVAAMQASERWLAGVRIKTPNPKEDPELVELHSLVHNRQVEGLVRFAEAMAWPALREMRAFAEEVYAGIRAGRRLDTSCHLFDWLYGLMLPGNMFVFTIMAALVDATPSLRHLGAAEYYASGLVVGDRSYWRANTVLGRVLGGMKGIQEVNGWIGPSPCPVVAGGDGDDQRATDGWWRAHAREAAFPQFDPNKQSDRFPPLFHRREDGVSSAEWLRGIQDRSSWVVPVGPQGSQEHVEFAAICLEKTASVLTSQQDTEKSDGKAKEPEQRAILRVFINKLPIEFPLYNKVTFLAAPTCIDGPHAVHNQDIPKMQHILQISQLPWYVHNDDRVLIIDATGGGECELAARGWCSQYGQHAVLVRGRGACFACAVSTASKGGLALGCVIWSRL